MFKVYAMGGMWGQFPWTPTVIEVPMAERCHITEFKYREL